MQDPFDKNVPGIGVGRDPCRTPMQWDDSPGAGFTNGVPWLPIGADRAVVNVRAQAADTDSMLSLHAALLRLRRKHAALSVGSYETCSATGDSATGDSATGAVLAYMRSSGSERLFVALNLGGGECSVALPPGMAQGRILLSTHGLSADALAHGRLQLRPHEGVIVIGTTRPHTSHADDTCS